MDNNNSKLTIIIRAFLYCGAIACPLFIISVIVEGSTRQNYDALRYPLSSLSIGENGWSQISNFIFTGILLIIFSFGLRKIFQPQEAKFRGPLFIMLAGIGLVGAGIFITDPIFGYPENAPLKLSQYTWHGHLHDAFSMLVFICLPWACFSFRKYFKIHGNHSWSNYSAFTAAAMIITFVITSMGFKQLPGFVDVAGLLQRLCIAFGWMWMTLLSLYALRR